MKIDLRQLDFVDSMLKILVYEVERVLGKEVTITSIYRINDDGVHGTLPCRGIDIREKNKYIGKYVERHINEMFLYDPNRPDKKCCWFHDVGKGVHIHLQSHPKTIWRLKDGVK